MTPLATPMVHNAVSRQTASVVIVCMLCVLSRSTTYQQYTIQVCTTGTAAFAAYDVARDVDDVISDASLEESRRNADSESSDDATSRYPAEVIVEGQQMNKVSQI